VRAEFDAGPGFAWITHGREIENYLETEVLASAISRAHPGVEHVAPPTRYDNPLAIRRAGAPQTADKMKVARTVVESSVPDLGVGDLRRQLSKLERFIADANR
jgi:hypothetical protein